MQNVDTESPNRLNSYDYHVMANDDLFINQVSQQANIWSSIFRTYERYLQKVYTFKDSIQIELIKYAE